MIYAFIKGAVLFVIGMCLLGVVAYGAIVSFVFALATGESWIYISYAFVVFALVGGVCGAIDYLEKRKRIWNKK